MEATEGSTTVTDDRIRQQVRDSYGRIAELNSEGCCTVPDTESPCCTPETKADGCCDSSERASRKDPGNAAIQLGYAQEDLDGVPDGANMGLGCGNPGAIAELKPGEVVVDLGSGGGFDCFLASRAVGETGEVIGVDMTPQMISKARTNAERSGSTNVSFRLGEIENLPVADETANVIMSNCVINLSPDKPRVMAEAFRILKPGGRLAISDIVATRPLPDSVQNDVNAYCGCIAGAALLDDYVQTIEAAGFEAVSIDAVTESREVIQDWLPNSGIEDHVVSARITARRPRN